MLFFGSGEAVLRLVPALAGTGTIPLFYLLGREFHNRETGLVAATLLAISSFHIYYSQEARPYTVFLFFFSLALIFYLRACRTNSGSAWILFGVFSALSCWAHLFGIVFVVPLFLLPLLVPFFSIKTGIRDLKPVLLAGAIWFLLSLPMLLVMVGAGLENADAAGTWGYQGIAVITSTVQEEFGQYNVGIIIMCILFLTGLVWILHNDWKRFMFIVCCPRPPSGYHGRSFLKNGNCAPVSDRTPPLFFPWHCVSDRLIALPDFHGQVFLCCNLPVGSPQYPVPEPVLLRRFKIWPGLEGSFPGIAQPDRNW